MKNPPNLRRQSVEIVTRNVKEVLGPGFREVRLVQSAGCYKKSSPVICYL